MDLPALRVDPLEKGAECDVVDLTLEPSGGGKGDHLLLHGRSDLGFRQPDPSEPLAGLWGQQPPEDLGAFGLATLGLGLLGLGLGVGAAPRLHLLDLLEPAFAKLRQFVVAVVRHRGTLAIRGTSPAPDGTPRAP